MGRPAKETHPPGHLSSGDVISRGLVRKNPLLAFLTSGENRRNNRCSDNQTRHAKRSSLIHENSNSEP